VEPPTTRPVQNDMIPSFSSQLSWHSTDNSKPRHSKYTKRGHLKLGPSLCAQRSNAQKCSMVSLTTPDNDSGPHESPLVSTLEHQTSPSTVNKHSSSRAAATSCTTALAFGAGKQLRIKFRSLPH
jgi:hypothetical protein